MYSILKFIQCKISKAHGATCTTESMTAVKFTPKYYHLEKDLLCKFSVDITASQKRINGQTAHKKMAECVVHAVT